MKTDTLSTLIINKLTQEQYDAALEANNINENEIYLIPVEKTQIIDTVLPALGWNKEESADLFSLTLLVDGVTDSNINEISFSKGCTEDQIKIYQKCGLRDGGQSEGQIILLAKRVPSEDIPITIIVRKDC